MRVRIACSALLSALSGFPLIAQDGVVGRERVDDLFESAPPAPPADRPGHTRSEVWQFEERDPLSSYIPWKHEVDRRLEQWAALQNEDGSFGAEDQDRLCLTALTTLAFSLRGHTCDSASYGDLLQRAVRWMLERQDQDGRIAVDGVEYSRRVQAQAAFALIDVSYSPDYPRLEFPRLMPHARRAVSHLESPARSANEKADDREDVWATAALAYATRAALREPPTRGGPAPGTKSDLEESVVAVLGRRNTFEEVPALRARLSSDEFSSWFVGSDPDAAFFAALAGGLSDARRQQETVLHSWIAGEAVGGWEPASLDPVALTHANLMRTLQIEAMFFLLLPKERAPK